MVPLAGVRPDVSRAAIAYYHCSSQAGATESSCRPEEDELRITQKNSLSDQWNDETVDSNGGSIPRLAFLPTSSKRIVAYRAHSTNIVTLAVEK